LKFTVVPFLCFPQLTPVATNKIIYFPPVAVFDALHGNNMHGLRQPW
jgi:hypothetical protein